MTTISCLIFSAKSKPVGSIPGRHAGTLGSLQLINLGNFITNIALKELQKQSLNLEINETQDQIMTSGRSSRNDPRNKIISIKADSDNRYCYRCGSDTQKTNFTVSRYIRPYME